MKVTTMAVVAAGLGISLLCVAQLGCECPGGKCDVKAGSTTKESVALCTSCGQIKGSDVCCKPGQPTCDKCNLVKGSPGCCNIKKGSTEPVALCTKCGQIEGSDKCCKPGQTICSKCNLVKGSPGCCKIKKT